MLPKVMEYFRIEDLTLPDFQEIKQSRNKAEKLCFASKFLSDLHEKFLDILRLNNETSESTSYQLNDRKNEGTPDTPLNGSFLTSTPDSKARKNFHQNKNLGLSPFSPPSFDRKVDRRGRSRVSLGDVHQNNIFDDSRSRHGHKNGPRTGSSVKFQPVLTFNLNENEFPSISESSTKPKRRLSTTVVSSGNNSGETSSNFANKTDEEWREQNQAFEKPTIIPAPATAMPRSLWARPPQEVVESSCSIQNPNPAKPMERNVCSSPQPMRSRDLKIHEPRVKDVTNVDELNLLADFYSDLINGGLTSGVMNEFYLVVQLLTISVDAGKCKIAGRKYFSSPSNVVYFSCRVLQNISCWLEFLDRETLKLLSGNKRLQQFAPGLVQNISDLVGVSLQEDIIQDEVTLSGGINFDQDTDTRSNFPSNNAFNIFKKQRDMFYQLLREWEKEHLSIGWSMRSKVDTIQAILIGCHPTLTDQLRFVRLFVSQLVKTCCSGNTSKDNSQLSELKTADPDKLKRLQGRLVGFPPPSSDVNPSFPKSQEFFRDFILLSSANSFHAFLLDALYAKIDEVSESTTNLILDSSSNCDTTSTSFQSGFLNQITTLQVLGKFLGFVTYLPYRTEECLTQYDESALIAMRNRLPDRIKILSELQHHLQKGSLVVGLSWTLNHLGLMDNTATRLQATLDVFEFLVTIHHSSFEAFPNSKSKMFVLSSNMLGWFFELDIFPKDLLFKNLKTFDLIKMERLKASLDHNINVSREVISRCHPTQSGRIQHLLQHCNIANRFGKPPTRKINPKSAPPDRDPREETCFANNVKKKLELSFFQMHSASLKRSVEFVCDRIFSLWVLEFQNRQIKACVKKAQMFARNVAANLSEGFDKKSLADLMKENAEDLKNKMIFGGDSLLDSFCERARLVLANLLPEPTVPQVLSISTSICCKNIKEKAFDWKRGNLSSGVFLKEIASELNKQFQLYDHLSDYLIQLSRANGKSFSNSEDAIEIICTGGNREATGSFSINPGDRSLDLSMRSTDSKVLGQSLTEIHDDDGMDANNSMNNHSMLLALNASESNINDLSSVFLENPQKDDKTNPLKQGARESVTKICKIEEEADPILPSEVIISVQDLLVSLSLQSEGSGSDVIEVVLCQVKRALEDPHKLLHGQARSILYSLTVSLALTIIREAETRWSDRLEDEFVSLWRHDIDSNELEELFHATKTVESPTLNAFLKRLHEESIITRID